MGLELPVLLKDWYERYELVKLLNQMLDNNTLTVRQEEGSDQNAYHVELMPDGRITIWTE